MNRLIVLIYVCFIVLSFTFAQADSTKQYLLTTSTENISLTAVDLLDPYLSPLVYIGVGVGYQHSDMKYFKKYVGLPSLVYFLWILKMMTYSIIYILPIQYILFIK